MVAKSSRLTPYLPRGSQVQKRIHRNLCRSFLKSNPNYLICTPYHSLLMYLHMLLAQSLYTYHLLLEASRYRHAKA